MTDVIIMTESGEKNKKLLAIEYVNKIAIVEVAKVSSSIDLRNKHNQVISNTNMDVAKDLKLIGIKKYQKCTDQIQDKIDWLHKDWIPTIGAFVKHFWRMYNNEEIIKNMITRREIDSE